MPIGQKEEHPYLSLGAIPGATRLILGSFPVYDCTDPDSAEKRNNRAVKGAFSFFYGSAYSSFWELYGKFVDQTIHPPYDPRTLCVSMATKAIAISDLIKSCERVGVSSADNDLRGRIWNNDGIKELISDGVCKILCTSKGVLSNLQTAILCKSSESFAKVDQEASLTLQANFLQKINGELKEVTPRIASVFRVHKDGAILQAIAIPSPGSPKRQLHRFGFSRGDRNGYVDRYFRSAFEWLVK